MRYLLTILDMTMRFIDAVPMPEARPTTAPKPSLTPQSASSGFRPAKLQTYPAELFLGQTPMILGDLAGADLDSPTNIMKLLHKLQVKASRAPVQTAHHAALPTRMPQEMHRATHVDVQRGKNNALGGQF